MKRSLAVIFIFINVIVCAQEETMDSLKIALKKAKHDTVRCNILEAMIELESDDKIWSKYNLQLKAIAESHLKTINVPPTALQKTYILYLSHSINNSGFLADFHGDLKKAKELYEKSLGLSEKINDFDGVATAYNNIALIHQSNGDITTALQYLKKCMTIYETQNNKDKLAQSLNNMALILQNQGDLPKALENYMKSLSYFRETNDKAGEASCLNNIGHIYNDIGDKDKTLEYFNESLKIKEEINNIEGIATSLNNIGVIYQNSGQTQAALENFNKSLMLREQLNDHEGMANSLNNLGNVHLGIRDFTRALEYNFKSLKLYEKMEDKGGMANALNNIGNAYSKQKNYNKAIEYLKRSNELSRSIWIPRDIKNSANALSNAYIKQNNLIEAEKYQLQILELITKGISINFPVLSEKEKELYYKTISADFNRFNSFSFIRQTKNPHLLEILYNNALKNKGLLLKSSTAMNNAIMMSKDQVLINKYQTWIEQKKHIAKLYGAGKDTKLAEEQANEMEKELAKSSQIFSDFDKIQNLTWQDVRKGLNENEAAIEFINFGHEGINDTALTNIYCALILKKNSTYPEMIKVCNEDSLSILLESISGNNFYNINRIYGNSRSPVNSLYKLIWQPLEGTLNGYKTIYVSPSGLLHKVSFAALRKSENTYLTDLYDIYMHSSTGKIAMPENSSFNSNSTISLFGGINYNGKLNQSDDQHEGWKYLAGTKEETEKIALILKSQNIHYNYYFDSLASENEFKTVSANSHIIHISTHGFFFSDPELSKTKLNNIELQKEKQELIVFRGGNDGFGVWTFVKNKNPLMRSGLVLAGANDVWNTKYKSGNDEDGVLTAAEVATMDLRKTGLVVLSACETGLGDIKGSEGVYGLQRAFKMAGVKYIIMSLWQVPDKETSEFMTTFYTHLTVIKDIKKAFNQTQHEMRKKYDPYFWAAFVLVE